MIIPKNHPRAKSLYIREKLVQGFDKGLVAKEGLIAHGRGETFDYLLGEKTSKNAKKAIRAAALTLLSAKSAVISVNGNLAALCPKETVELANVVKAKIEVNLFYTNEKRKKEIIKILKKNGANIILGTKSEFSKEISGLTSARRVVDRKGIYSADVVFVPLEDGDRTIALRKLGKKIVTVDLNPLSRTAQTANITIIDNVVRCMNLLINESKKLTRKNRLEKPVLSFDNKKNLADAIIQIRNNLEKRAANA